MQAVTCLKSVSFIPPGVQPLETKGQARSDIAWGVPTTIVGYKEWNICLCQGFLYTQGSRLVYPIYPGSTWSLCY